MESGKGTREKSRQRDNLIFRENLIDRVYQQQVNPAVVRLTPEVMVTTNWGG